MRGGMMDKLSTTQQTPGAERPFAWLREVTPYQWRIFAVVWLAWILDSIDFLLFSFVLRPALTELIGGEPTLAEIGQIGGLVAMSGLLGWSIGGFVFGVAADYFGRIRTLAVGILVFSVCTALQGFAHSPFELGLYRFLGGLGTGSIFVIGIPLFSEAFAGNRSRAKFGGVLMTGGAFASLLGAVVYGLIGSFGWRYVFYIGITPAVLLFFFLGGMREPEQFAAVRERRLAAKEAGSNISVDDREFLRFAPLQLFGKKLLFNTIVGLLFALGTLVSIWTTLIWLPTIQTMLLEKEGVTGAAAIAAVSRNMQLFGITGIFGYITHGFLADRFGRRATIAFFNIGALVFGLYLYFGLDHYGPYPYLLSVFGYFIWGAFSGHGIYLPELFPTHVRATGVSFCNGTGRIVTSFGPLVAGLLVAPFGGNFSKAAGVMLCFLLLSLLSVIIGPETKDRDLQ
jgi:MFS family permease